MYMFGVVGEIHEHDYFEVISFYNSKDNYSGRLINSLYVRTLYSSYERAYPPSPIPPFNAYVLNGWSLLVLKKIISPRWESCTVYTV